MMKIIGINAALVFIGLIAAELIFGSWFSDTGYGVINLPRNVRFESNVQTLYDGPETITYSRDENGLRGDFSAPDAIDILVIGGSTTNEMYIDDRATWVQVMQSRLREAGIERVVANAGVDGQSTVGHIWNFREWFPNIAGLKPEIVLAYVGVNERAAADVDADFREIPMHTDWPRRAKQYVRNNSAVYNLYKTVKGTLEARRRKLTHRKLDFQGEALERQPLAEFRARACEARDQAAYRERLGVMKAEVDALGARLVLATQTRGDVRVQGDTIEGVQSTHALEAQHRLMCFNRATLAFCDAQDDVTCIDVAGGAALGPGDFYDIVHTNPAGSAKVGAFMAEKLAPVLTAR